MSQSIRDNGRTPATRSELANGPAPGPHIDQSGAVPPLTPLSLRESDRAALRPMVAEFENLLSHLDAQTDIQGYTAASAQIALSWHRLVALMALGQPPELRACPHCGYRIFSAATRCIQCWKQSPAADPGPPI